jgi:hypothetical protein
LATTHVPLQRRQELVPAAYHLIRPFDQCVRPQQMREIAHSLVEFGIEQGPVGAPSIQF